MDRRRISVLLVEDEEIHRVVARAVLRAAGVEADEAENGAEAVRRVRERVGGAYDLILTDKQMPVMDGHEVYTYTLVRHSRCMASVCVCSPRHQQRPPDECVWYGCGTADHARACVHAGDEADQGHGGDHDHRRRVQRQPPLGRPGLHRRRRRRLHAQAADQGEAGPHSLQVRACVGATSTVVLSLAQDANTLGSCR